MARWLRQSTAVDVAVGPFLDATDGVTAETALTISQADVRLKKNNGAWAQVNDSTAATHEENGWYEKELDTTDTNTLGILIIAVHEAGALPIWHEFNVVPANVWDSFFAADLLQVDSTQLLGTAYATPTVAGVQEVDLTHVAGSTTDVSTMAASVAAILVDTGTTLQGELDGIQADTEDIQARLPAALVSGRIDASAGAIAANAITAASMAADASAEIADAVFDEDVTGHVIPDSFGEILTDISVDASDIQATVNALTSLLAGTVMAAGTIGATGNDSTHVHLVGFTYGDDEINNNLLVIKDVSANEYHARWITDYVGATDLATVATLPFTPENNVDTFWLLPMRQDVTGGSGLDAAGVRAAVGLASANLDTQLSTIDTVVDAILVDTGTTLDAAIDNLPTNAELATALGTADDAVLTAIAALNNLSQANIRTAVGLASANLDTQLDALPTNAELATALGTADDATLAAIAALNNLSQANIRTAVGLASANLDTQLGAIDTVVDTILVDTAELQTDWVNGGRLDNILDARASQTSVDDVPTNAELATALAAADDAVLAAITALAVPTAIQNADALLDRANAIETGATVRAVLRLIAAVLVGKVSGAGTGTETFRNTVADSKDRVVATVDSSGNRTAITTDST